MAPRVRPAQGADNTWFTLTSSEATRAIAARATQRRQISPCEFRTGTLQARKWRGQRAARGVVAHHAFSRRARGLSHTAFEARRAPARLSPGCSGSALMVSAPFDALGTSSGSSFSSARVASTSSNKSSVPFAGLPRSARIVLRQVSTSSFAEPMTSAGPLPGPPLPASPTRSPSEPPHGVGGHAPTNFAN